uniref:Glutamyl-tRNA(Gln) amidotransferase subunit B, mitochondrial n=1 Tax=Strigamia maritima TaxID=126957 RepID=T1J1Q9_STRMM
WESVVGLEIHAQIASESKLFSSSGTSFTSPVNSQVSFFDAALPGTLPVLNRRCVRAAVLTALALKCKINKVSTFDRKHYFYADLPAGYQITQQIQPLANDGVCNFSVTNNTRSPYEASSRVLQLQLEQDSGKSLHDDVENQSLIDLNRAGMALMEIVFDCDLTNGEEAAALVDELQLLFRCLATCSAKMEEGALRVDANVSINRPGEPKGVRTEIKNIGSVRGVARAVDFEINRQIQLRESNLPVTNETRMFDSKSRKTVLMRDKETLQDYRFMPEPNLPPLRLSEHLDCSDGSVSIPLIASQMPPLPDQVRSRVVEKYKIPLYMARILVREGQLMDYFEGIIGVNPRPDPTKVFNLLLNDLYTLLNKHELPLAKCEVSTKQLAELLHLYVNKVITDKIKLSVLEVMLLGDRRSPETIVEENDWKQISDDSYLTQLCQQVLDDNEKLVKQYRAGKTKVLNNLMATVRTSSKNKANMSAAMEILKKLLENKN